MSACTLAARLLNPGAKAVSAYRCPQRIDGSLDIVATTKSKRVRVVKFSPELGDELAALWAEQHPADAAPLKPAEAVRLSRSRALARYPATDADLVIRTPVRVTKTGKATGGGPVAKGVDNDLWHQTVAATGIRSRGRDVHAARHAAAATMIAAGVPPTTVKDVLGHTNIAVTMRYVTTNDDAQEAALAAMAAYKAARAAAANGTV